MLCKTPRNIFFYGNLVLKKSLMNILTVLSVARISCCLHWCKRNIFVPGDVKKSINLSYQSLSVTLLWPVVANWTMKMHFLTTLLDRKLSSPQSVQLTSSKVAESTHTHTCPHAHTPTHTHFEYKSIPWRIFNVFH